VQGRQLKVSVIAYETDVSEPSVLAILCNYLGMLKVGS
jgi:hypothetical protein